MVPTMSARRNKHHSDKRKNLRIPIEDVTFEIYAEDGQPDTPEVCEIANLSEGGLLFTSSKAYTISQPLRLTFIIPNTILTVRTDAVVVHSYVDLSGKYVGVRFAKLDVPEQSTIKHYVEEKEHN
jgi:PilZ domain-containing protein